MLSRVYKVDEDKLNNDLSRVKDVNALVCSNKTLGNWDSLIVNVMDIEGFKGGMRGRYKSIPIYINDDVPDGYIDIQ